MPEAIKIIVPGFFLLIEGIRDFRQRSISMISVGIFAVLGIIVQMVYDWSNWKVMLGGILFGGTVLLAAKITEEKIGYGDGWILVVTGIYLGFRDNLVLFALALFLSAIVSVVLLMLKKVTRKTTMPFVAFVFLGYCVMLIGVI